MPRRAPSPCHHPGCHETGTDTRCPTHTRAHRQARDTDTRWVYRHPRWRPLRTQVLDEQPWCADTGCTQMAVDVDHIVPLAFGGKPFDRTNLQGLCKPHHSIKTNREMFGHNNAT